MSKGRMCVVGLNPLGLAALGAGLSAGFEVHVFYGPEDLGARFYLDDSGFLDVSRLYATHGSTVGVHSLVDNAARAARVVRGWSGIEEFPTVKASVGMRSYYGSMEYRAWRRRGEGSGWEFSEAPVFARKHPKTEFYARGVVPYYDGRMVVDAHAGLGVAVFHQLRVVKVGCLPVRVAGSTGGVLLHLWGEREPRVFDVGFDARPLFGEGVLRRYVTGSVRAGCGDEVCFFYAPHGSYFFGLTGGRTFVLDAVHGDLGSERERVALACSMVGSEGERLQLLSAARGKRSLLECYPFGWVGDVSGTTVSGSGVGVDGLSVSSVAFTGGVGLVRAGCYATGFAHRVFEDVFLFLRGFAG